MRSLESAYLDITSPTGKCLTIKKMSLFVSKDTKVKRTVSDIYSKINFTDDFNHVGTVELTKEEMIILRDSNTTTLK